MTTRRLVAASLLGGFAVMVLELAAVRILAPWFGDSAYVWTNAIGVLLAAMALGAWVGGRISVSGGTRRLAVLLLVGGAWSALAPLFVQPLSSGLLPDRMALEGAGLTLTLGSLAATTVLFALPVLLAAASSPVLVTAIVEQGATVGRAAGLVATASTLGSLFGTFGATHLLIPGLGSRVTVWVAAAAILGAAVLVHARPRNALVLLLPLGFALVPFGPLRPVGEGVELLAERESELQFLQVQRVGDPSQVQLKINEGLDSFHSVRVDPESWTGGLYYDFHAIAPFLAFDGEPGRPVRMLSLGSAAGTFGVIYRSAFPGAAITSVELDPTVVDLGREFFRAYPEGEGRVYPGMDARVFVDRSQGEWDVVLVDAYERQVYLPAHVVSREFFHSVHDRLRKGGVVSVNVGGRSFSDPVLQAVTRTIRDVFGEVLAMRIPSSRNYLVVARKGDAVAIDALSSIDRDRPAALRAALEQSTDPANWTAVLSEGAVLTDDRPFLDELQDSFYRRQGERGAARTIGGERPSREALEEARQHYQTRHFRRAIEAACESAEETVALRELIGRARFDVGEIDGSRAEYEAARRLTDDASERARLDGILRFFEPYLERSAEAGASRSVSLATFLGWSALLVLTSVVLTRRP